MAKSGEKSVAEEAKERDRVELAVRVEREAVDDGEGTGMEALMEAKKRARDAGIAEQLKFSHIRAKRDAAYAEALAEAKGDHRKVDGSLRK
jgi:hypothetical protein